MSVAARTVSIDEPPGDFRRDRNSDDLGGAGGARRPLNPAGSPHGSKQQAERRAGGRQGEIPGGRSPPDRAADRKSTRLNSSHPSISYAVFCLKKKKHPFLVDGVHLACTNCVVTR